MSKTVTIWVKGDPAPQSRPRFMGDRVVSSVSPALRDWRKRMTAAMVAAKIETLKKAICGPIQADVIFLLKTKDKKRWWKMCPMKPDVDNLVKCAFDCAENAGFFDVGDQQIVDARIRKIWVPADRAGMEISFWKTDIGVHQSFIPDDDGIDWLARAEADEQEREGESVEMMF